MHRINTKVSGWVSFFTITAVLSMLAQPGFAQREESSGETKPVTLTATVGAPPPGISLKDALKDFPGKVAFEYDYAEKGFKTDAKAFVVNNILALEYNVTLQTNKRLAHEDNENVKDELTAVLRVGSEAPAVNDNTVIKWCRAGEMPAPISFEIQKSEEAPTQGNYSGEMVLVFEPSSSE